MIYTTVSLVLVAVFSTNLQSLFSLRHQAPRPHESRDQHGPDSQKPKERPTDVVFLLNDVRSAPPEFAADILISFAGSGKITDQAWKKELLQEAFSLASGTQEPLPRQMTGPYDVDTRDGYLSYAFQTKLDSLSLQCRVINAMLPIDKVKARELFSEMPKLKLKSLSCEDGLVYDVSEFYNTLANVAKSAFNGTEMNRNDHIRFMESISDI